MLECEYTRKVLKLTARDKQNAMLASNWDGSCVLNDDSVYWTETLNRGALGQ